jgi:hypothetical protein
VVKNGDDASAGTSDPSGSSAPADTVKAEEKSSSPKAGTETKKFRGIPEDVRLFEMFWKQVVELIKVSDYLPFAMIIADILGSTRPFHPGRHGALRVSYQSIPFMLPR